MKTLNLSHRWLFSIDRDFQSLNDKSAALFGRLVHFDLSGLREVSMMSGADQATLIL